MGLVLNQLVKVKLGGSNIKYYENKGYILPYKKDKRERITIPKGSCINVKIQDLQNGSESLVNVICDCCGELLKPMPYYAYNNYVHEDGTYYCNRCIKNNNIKWESIFESNPEFIKYFINQEDTKKYSSGSNKKVHLKCPDCGHEKYMTVYNLINRGFSCICKDSISYPEKFVFNFLQQIKIDFIFQLTNKYFKWCKKYRYDFYIPSINCIIEVNGGQHYIQSGIGRSLKQEKENDKTKKVLALNNNITNYIIIDARKSEMEYIKDSIINSELVRLFDFANINWLECHENACKSLIKEACNLWEDGIKNTQELAKKLKISRRTIIDYLKQGSKLGYTSYSVKNEILKTKQSKPVRCINTNEIFCSQGEAIRHYKINEVSLSKCCHGIYKSAGKHPITGEKLHWEYYIK